MKIAVHVKRMQPWIQLLPKEIPKFEAKMNGRNPLKAKMYFVRENIYTQLIQ